MKTVFGVEAFGWSFYSGDSAIYYSGKTLFEASTLFFISFIVFTAQRASAVDASLGRLAAAFCSCIQLHSSAGGK
jgi:hypothetical protein